MIDDIIRTQIRLPAALHEALEKAAQLNHHSLNQEMVIRLQASISAETNIVERLSAIEMQNQQIIALLNMQSAQKNN
ncbi:MAG: Arc family DNA-binding protein [Proteobacteria bacterium]|nr:Arc family DNA-binding protein [Pseudomonadota bacterium]